MPITDPDVEIITDSTTETRVTTNTSTTDSGFDFDAEAITDSTAELTDTEGVSTETPKLWC